MSHHGDDNPATKEVTDALRKAMREVAGEYPNGRLNKNDEGARACGCTRPLTVKLE